MAEEKIVYCRCAYAQVVPEDVKAEVLQRLAGSGVSFECVSDLCEMSARRDPRLEAIFGEGEVRVAACHPRAVRWLLHAAGIDAPPERVKVANMREDDAERVANETLGE